MYPCIMYSTYYGEFWFRFCFTTWENTWMKFCHSGLITSFWDTYTVFIFDNFENNDSMWVHPWIWKSHKEHQQTIWNNKQCAYLTINFTHNRNLLASKTKIIIMRKMQRWKSLRLRLMRLVLEPILKIESRKIVAAHHRSVESERISW